jgi:hypothetical protein
MRATTRADMRQTDLSLTRTAADAGPRVIAKRPGIRAPTHALSALANGSTRTRFRVAAK